MYSRMVVLRKIAGLHNFGGCTKEAALSPRQKKIFSRGDKGDARSFVRITGAVV